MKSSSRRGSGLLRARKPSTLTLEKRVANFIVSILAVFGCLKSSFAQEREDSSEAILSRSLDPITLNNERTKFMNRRTGDEFVVWGLNYDHDRKGRLIEEYWDSEWSTVVSDFKEMKSLGANVVRIHLQLGKFVHSPTKMNAGSMRKLTDLLALAEETGLYLNLTGLGCYHKNEVPSWYDRLDESERWNVQAFFWREVAKICSKQPALFCYDLMNEPILPGSGKVETDWLAGEFGGKHFVQRISLDLVGRTREEVANLWVQNLVGAIREHDPNHLITVGVIPWAHTFANVKPIFYSEGLLSYFDFVSVHFYPKKEQIDKALRALRVYDLGLPLVIEETFPLHCEQKEWITFWEKSKSLAEGWMGFYWGKEAHEYSTKDGIAGAMMKSWLQFFQTHKP